MLRPMQQQKVHPLVTPRPSAHMRLGPVAEDNEDQEEEEEEEVSFNDLLSDEPGDEEKFEDEVEGEDNDDEVDPAVQVSGNTPDNDETDTVSQASNDAAVAEVTAEAEVNLERVDPSIAAQGYQPQVLHYPQGMSVIFFLHLFNMMYVDNGSPHRRGSLLPVRLPEPVCLEVLHGA
jgi:hypothetical protein